MTPSAAISLDADPRNPGEFFACCGLLEVADRLWLGGAEGWFTERQFHLAPMVAGNTTQLSELMQEVCSLQVQVLNSESPGVRSDGEEALAAEVDEVADGLEGDETAVGEVEEDATDDEDGEGEPEKAKTPKVPPLLVRSHSGKFEMILDWWMKFATAKKRVVEAPTELKTWAANATSRQMLAKWLPHDGKKEVVQLRRFWDDFSQQITSDPSTALELPDFRLQGSYGFDARAGWEPLEVGFSLNEHSSMKHVLVSPAVEVLGAIGLQRFTPAIEGRREAIVYATWSSPLAPSAARAASAGLLPAVTTATYRSAFTKRGSFWGLDYSSEL